MATDMSVLPLPDLDALSLDELKKLVVQLLVRVSALEEENQQLRAENGRLKDLPKKPKLAPGGMDKATEPDKRARTKLTLPRQTGPDTVFSVKPFTASRSEEGCHRARSGQGQGAPSARGPAALLDLPCARRPAGGQIGTTG